MSQQPTTVFITGASRGIGRALVEAYLKRPNHTVIASVRDREITPLKGLETAAGSRIEVVEIDSKSSGDAAEAVKELKDKGIVALDIVIAAAGINPHKAWKEVTDIDPGKMEEIFQVNTFAFVKLLHAVFPLLQAAHDDQDRRPGQPPKLLALSSGAAAIKDMEKTIAAPVGAYGASKAALNYLVRRAHLENKWLACWAANPGFVQTGTGNDHARRWKMEKAPQELGPVVEALMRQVDEATAEGMQGNFFDHEGKELEF